MKTNFVALLPVFLSSLTVVAMANATSVERPNELTYDPRDQLNECVTKRSEAQLLADLKSPIKETRFAAACELGRLNSKKAYAPLLNLLQNDPVGEVREISALALSGIGDEHSAAVMVERLFKENQAIKDDRMDSNLQRNFSRDGNYLGSLTSNLGYAIGMTGTEKEIPRLVERLAQKSTSADGMQGNEGRDAAAYAISMIVQKAPLTETLRNQIGETLVEVIKNDASLNVYWDAMFALGEIRYASAMPLLEKILMGEFQTANRYSESSDVLQVLPELHSPAVIAPLRRYIKEELNGDLTMGVRDNYNSLNGPICDAFKNSGDASLPELNICRSMGK